MELELNCNILINENALQNIICKMSPMFDIWLHPTPNCAQTAPMLPTINRQQFDTDCYPYPWRQNQQTALEYVAIRIP